MSTFKLEQKRLEQIRKQLYGKQTEGHHKTNPSKTERTTNTPVKSSPSKSTTLIDNEHYITKDLWKVFVFSVIAISLQVLIHQALLNKWIHINFYGITY